MSNRSLTAFLVGLAALVVFMMGIMGIEQYKTFVGSSVKTADATEKLADGSFKIAEAEAEGFGGLTSATLAQSQPEDCKVLYKGYPADGSLPTPVPAPYDGYSNDPDDLTNNPCEAIPQNGTGNCYRTPNPTPTPLPIPTPGPVVGWRCDLITDDLHDHEVYSDATLDGTGEQGSPLSVASPFSTAEKNKLAGIQADAQPNPKHVAAFAVLTSNTRDQLSPGEIGFFDAADALMQNKSVQKLKGGHIEVANAVAAWNRDASSPATPLGEYTKHQSLLNDALDNGGSVIIGITRHGTTSTAWAQAETANAITGGYSLTNIEKVIGDIDIVPGVSYNITLAHPILAPFASDVIGTMPQDKIADYQEWVKRVELAGHEDDEFSSYSNAFVAEPDRRGLWTLSSDSNGPPTTANLFAQTHIADRTTNGVIAMGLLRTDADPNNLQWDTALAATDLVNGAVWYASIDGDKSAHLKITLTSNGTLVGTDKAAYIWATATWDEVGDIADVQEYGNYFRLGRELPSKLQVELPYTDILGAPWLLVDGSNVTYQTKTAIQGNNEDETLGVFTRVASGLESSGDDRFGDSGTTITFSVAADSDYQSESSDTNDAKLYRALKARAWVKFGNGYEVEVVSLIPRYLSQGRAQYLVNLKVLAGQVVGVNSTTSVTIIGEDVHRGQLAPQAFLEETPNIAGDGGNEADVWTRGSSDSNADWAALPGPTKSSILSVTSSWQNVATSVASDDFIIVVTEGAYSSEVHNIAAATWAGQFSDLSTSARWVGIRANSGGARIEIRRNGTAVQARTQGSTANTKAWVITLQYLVLFFARRRDRFCSFAPKPETAKSSFDSLSRRKWTDFAVFFAVWGFRDFGLPCSVSRSCRSYETAKGGKQAGAG